MYERPSIFESREFADFMVVSILYVLIFLGILRVLNRTYILIKLKYLEKSNTTKRNNDKLDSII